MLLIREVGLWVRYGQGHFSMLHGQLSGQGGHTDVGHQKVICDGKRLWGLRGETVEGSRVYIRHSWPCVCGRVGISEMAWGIGLGK